MNNQPLHSKKFSFFSIFILLFGMVCIISYISLHQFIFVSKKTLINGKNMIKVAKNLRAILQKKHLAERFTCKTEDHIDLAGLFIQRKDPKGTILLCHGYKCCKELNSSYADLFSDYNIVLFDFRAHGENKRTITTLGYHEYKDVIAVAKWIKTEKPFVQKKPLIILGVSMGGAATIRAAEHDPNLCDAFIIDSSFANLKSVLHNTFVQKSGLPTFPFLPIMKTMLNYVASCDIDSMKPNSIKHIKKPILLIHSCIDSVVPVQESLLMYAQAEQTVAKLWIGPKCQHGYLHKKYPELYKKKIENFLQRKVL